MTPAQRSQLEALVPRMKAAARRKVTHNAYRMAWVQIERLERFLNWPEGVGQEMDQPPSAEAWIELAEAAAK